MILAIFAYFGCFDEIWCGVVVFWLLLLFLVYFGEFWCYFVVFSGLVLI